MNIFEQATRKALRFQTTQGATVSVEDLWQMPLESKSHYSLQSVARTTHAALKANEEMDFISTKTTANALDELRMEVIKHIIAVKLEERDAKIEAIARAEKRARLQEIIATKQDQELVGKSLDELNKLMEELA